jgi:hypothetical protein
MAANVLTRLVRTGVVLALAAAGIMLYLGRPFAPDTCPNFGAPCHPPTIVVVQPSLLTRLSMLTAGYRLPALVFVVLLTSALAVLGVSRRERVPTSTEGLARPFC